MTFTYTVSDTPTDLTKVRYYLGDTDSATAMFTDEEISMVLSIESDDVGAAVISLIKTAKAKLAKEPDMQADWLKIDWRRSAVQWDILLGEMKEYFGLSWQLNVSALDTWRPDTLLTEAPDYTSDTTDE